MVLTITTAGLELVQDQVGAQGRKGWKCSVKASRRSLTLKVKEGSNWRGKKVIEGGFSYYRRHLSMLLI